ncbi:hypothetical protein FOZ61_002658, partial [Perkinsus olseni]
ARPPSTKNLPIKNPNTKHIHYVDDLAQLAKSTDDFFDLNECTSPNGLPLTTEDILSEDETTFYGVTLTDGADHISYSHARWQKLLDSALPPQATLRQLLSIVAKVTYQPDLLPPFVEPCKNLLQSELAHAANTTNWDSTAEPSLVNLIQSFLELCHKSTLPLLKRYINVNQPIKIYVDASAYCLGLIAYQNDQPILLRQQVLSPRAKDLYHTNTKELNGIAFAIETIRSIEIDRRVHFRYVTIYTDNSAAQSIILNQRVSSVHGKQTVHLLKVLRYLQDITDDQLHRFTIIHCAGPSNKADSLTRHPLLAQLTKSNNYNDDNYQPSDDQPQPIAFMAIKRPAEQLNSPNNPKHPKLKAIDDPTTTLPTTTCPTLDPSLLEILQSGATVSKPDRRQLLEQVHHDYGHEGITTVNKRVNAFNISWPELHSELEDLTKHCQTCQATTNYPLDRALKSPPSTIPQGLINSDAWSIIYMDVIGPYTFDNTQHYAITIMDSYSSSVIIYPTTSTPTTQDAIDALSTIQRHYHRHPAGLQ